MASSIIFPQYAEPRHGWTRERKEHAIQQIQHQYQQKMQKQQQEHSNAQCHTQDCDVVVKQKQNEIKTETRSEFLDVATSLPVVKKLMISYVLTHGTNMPPYIPTTSVTMEPSRLVMMESRCFYCSSESWADELVHRLFGIRHCEHHTWEAERDVREYLIRNNIIRMKDAAQHPILGPFLERLRPTLTVRRTSGALEENWYIPWTPPIAEEVPLFRKSSRGWGFHVTNGEVEKFVRLEELRHIPIVDQMLPEVQQVLEEGLYVSS